MSDQLFLDRLTAKHPTPLKDTLSFISFAPGELKICLSNAAGTLEYCTLTKTEANGLISDELGKTGGAYDRLDALEANTHSHPELATVNAFSSTGPTDLSWNGINLFRKIMTQEDW